MKLSRTADFPITAIGHNVYCRMQSSPIATCVDMDMATEIAVRLNRSEGISDKNRARGQADDLHNSDNQF